MKSWIFFAFMFVGWILAAIFAFTSMREVAIICLNQRANQKQRLQKVGFKKVLREVTMLTEEKRNEICKQYVLLKSYVKTDKKRNIGRSTVQKVIKNVK
ncbi:hypothetical protein M3Y96_00416200 [Aphelenchoides besseyi]|nr:hypothetical protein M3Y96_00416200 [Aphelenchoides besseyi]